MDTRSSGMSESLTLNSDDRTNSYIRSMIFRTDYVVPSLVNYVSVFVGSRDDIYDWFVVINKSIRFLMNLITISSSSNEINRYEIKTVFL